MHFPRDLFPASLPVHELNWLGRRRQTHMKSAPPQKREYWGEASWNLFEGGTESLANVCGQWPLVKCRAVWFWKPKFSVANSLLVVVGIITELLCGIITWNVHNPFSPSIRITNLKLPRKMRLGFPDFCPRWTGIRHGDKGATADKRWTFWTEGIGTYKKLVR